jgi:hypothetical protein
MSPIGAGHVVALVALAAAVRLPLLRVAWLWYDEATVGLTGLAVLRGELPTYFFGQPFMGALGDAYLAAPLYVAFGVSARTLKLLAVVLAVAWIALVVRLAWEAFGRRAAVFTALWLAIPPDYLMHWSHEARPHYLLSMTLGALALLLALRAPAVRPGRAVLQFALLGFVLGCAFWVNFLSLVYGPAVGALLLRRGVRWPVVGAALVALPAFALGSLPHWLYAVPHYHWAAFPTGSRIPLSALRTNLESLGDGWQLLSGVWGPLRGGVAGLLLGGLLALVYLAALGLAARAAWRAGSVALGATVALLVLAVTDVGVVVGTEYGQRLQGDARYLLPLYTALPPLFGYALARLTRPRAAAGITAVVLVFHAAGIVDGEYRALRPAAIARLDAYDAQLQATVATLERDGPRRLYAPDFSLRLFTFLSRERIVVSNPYEEIYPPYALAVAGAETAGWWFAQPDPAFEATLRALGIRFARRTVGQSTGIYTDFSLPPQGLRELDPARFTVTASVAPETASAMVDRDVGTLWSSRAPRRGGEWIEVDLGRVEPVALVRWLPGTYQEVPSGLVLEASRDGRAWQRLVDLPQYFGPLYWSAGRPMGHVRTGRVELRVPPTPARYLRITQTGQNEIRPWTIRVLFVYAAINESPRTPTADGPTLAGALRAAGVRRLYADHGWGSRAALADPSLQILPANTALDAYGFSGAADDFRPRLRWEPGSGVLLEPFEAESFAALARTSGLGVTRTSVGGLIFFAYAAPPPQPGTPLPASTLTVTASRHPELGHLAIDGDPTTRWATGHPQTPGDWVRIDLTPPRAVRAVRLWTATPSDSPRGLALEGSADGIRWRPLAAELSTEGPLRWGGMTALRDGVTAVRLDFVPVTLRALRLTLTRGDPVFDWSIHELTLYE